MAKDSSDNGSKSQVITVRLTGTYSIRYNPAKDSTTIAVWDSVAQRANKIWVKGRVESGIEEGAAGTVEFDIRLPEFVFLEEGSSPRLV